MIGRWLAYSLPRKQLQLTADCLMRARKARKGNGTKNAKRVSKGKGKRAKSGGKARRERKGKSLKKKKEKEDMKN